MFHFSKYYLFVITGENANTPILHKGDGKHPTEGPVGAPATLGSDASRRTPVCLPILLVVTNNAKLL